MRFLFALCALALIAGCSSGGMNTTPVYGSSGAAAQTSTTGPDANGCFRRNRYVKEEDLETGFKWRLHPDMRPNKFVSIALAFNALRTRTLVIRPWNDPRDVVKLGPGGSITNWLFTKPTFEIVIHEENPGFDRGPGAKINAVVCPE